jgi:hypothetical protein
VVLELSANDAEQACFDPAVQLGWTRIDLAKVAEDQAPNVIDSGLVLREKAGQSDTIVNSNSPTTLVGFADSSALPAWRASSRADHRRRARTIAPAIVCP